MYSRLDPAKPNEFKQPEVGMNSVRISSYDRVKQSQGVWVFHRFRISNIPIFSACPTSFPGAMRAVVGREKEAQGAGSTCQRVGVCPAIGNPWGTVVPGGRHMFGAALDASATPFPAPCLGLHPHPPLRTPPCANPLAAASPLPCPARAQSHYLSADPEVQALIDDLRVPSLPVCALYVHQEGVQTAGRVLVDLRAHTPTASAPSTHPGTLGTPRTQPQHPQYPEDPQCLE